MKYILITIAVLLSVISFGQSKKQTSIKKPAIKYRDTTWAESRYDTTYGIISYNIGEGAVRGKGIIVKFENWQFSSTVPPPQPYYEINKKGDTVSIAFGGSIGSRNGIWESAYIKTSTGYKIVDGKYTFIPD